VYHVGDDVGGILGVLDGRMEIHGRPNGHDSSLVFIAGPGFWTGEFATATGKPRIVSLFAHSDLTLLRLPRAEFLRIAAADPQAWHQLAVLSARNTALAIEVIEMLKRSDSTDRLGHALFMLFRELPAPGRTIQTSQGDLGALTRMSRGSVNAALAALEARGLVRPVYRGIEVIDPAGLQSVVAGE
jgi:CRP-like cAMP-binding protein